MGKWSPVVWVFKKPSHFPPLRCVTIDCQSCSGSLSVQPWTSVPRNEVGTGCPLASGNVRPSCLPFTPGIQPSRWSKDRFSIISTTTVSNGAFDGSMVVVVAGALDALDAVGFESDEHAASAAHDAAAAAPARKPRREIGSGIERSCDTLCGVDELLDHVEHHLLRGLDLVHLSHDLPDEVVDELLGAWVRRSGSAHATLCLGD